MARNKRFISGIYNYCDRWCERCAYTNRCRVYRDTERIAERHRQRGEDPHDLNTAVSDVARSFEKVRRLMERYAKANNLDLDEMAREGAAELAEPKRERSIDAHPMARGAMRYTKSCGELLKELTGVFNEARDEADDRSAFMDVQDEADQLARVRDAFEVLSWDHALILGKIRRALGGKLEAEDESDELRESCLSDAAGSAWVARKCLIRSKAALLAIYDWDPDRRDQVIELLAAAERLQRALESLIPEAVDFTWPPEED